MSELQEKASSLPEEPGVYRMIGAGGELLYVGKAKNLRKRVGSYFHGAGHSPRIAMMLAQVASIETSVTRSEAEALLLEANLIKGLSPRFNILYRDDKSYPYILVSGDRFPRLAFHRGALDKSARYFGPFPSAAAVRESIQLLQKIFLVRTCENSVFENRSRPCLLHQIKRCSAPCVGLIGTVAYAQDVRLAEWVLEGRQKDVLGRLERSMQEAAERLDFEAAAALRDRIRSLQRVLHRTYVSSEVPEDVDVIVAVERDGKLCVDLAMIRSGRHLGDRPHFPANAQGSSVEEAVAAFLGQHYLDHPLPQRIVLAGEWGEEVQDAAAPIKARGVAVAGPRGAAESAWISMAERNAAFALDTRRADTARTVEQLEALKEALGLTEPLRRIECFDVSHTGGEAVVGSCVVFDHGSMRKAEYRRYNVTGVQPGDDYAAMKQILGRRFEKVAAGHGICPDLLLIDGGRGQLACAREALAEAGLDGVPAVGVSKGPDRRPGDEEIVFSDGRASLRLGAGHPALLLIQQVRDEAHRFAVAGHRAKRARSRRVSRLEDIPGIGPVRRRRLLAQLGGWQGVVAATVEDLCRVEGIDRKLAELVYGRLHEGGPTPGR